MARGSVGSPGINFMKDSVGSPGSISTKDLMAATNQMPAGTILEERLAPCWRSGDSDGAGMLHAAQRPHSCMTKLPVLATGALVIGFWLPGPWSLGFGYRGPGHWFLATGALVIGFWLPGPPVIGHAHRTPWTYYAVGCGS